MGKMAFGGIGFRAKFLTFVLFSSCSSIFLTPIFADKRIFTAGAGITLGRSSRDPKYIIEFHNAESPFYTEKNLETITMTNNEGKKYSCFLPMVEETKKFKSVAQNNTSHIIVGSERATKLKSPDELLEILNHTCILRHEGWWIYEFCHLKTMRQLHLDDNNDIVQEFILGLFDPEATASFHKNHSDVSLLKDPRSKDASQRYHAHIYNNGTHCDLTNEPRETEVRFVCSESPAFAISFIKEISTCKYAVTIQSHVLCKHPMFQQERPTSHTIHCNELPNEDKEELEMEKSDFNHVAPMTNLDNQFAT